MADKVLRINVEMLTEEAKARLEALDRAQNGVADTAKKMGKAADDAADAVKKTGKAADDTAEAHKKAAASTDTHSSAVDTLTRRVAGYVSAAAVISAIRNTGEWGDELVTLSRRMNVSISDVQRLDFATRTNGTSIDQLSNALSTLVERAGGGDAGAIGRLNDFGISLQRLREDDPVDTVLALGRGLREITSSTEQAAAANDLFGRQWRELLPLFTSDITAAMDAADDLGQVLDPLLVAKAARMNDAIGNLQTSFKIWIAESLEPAIPLLEKIFNRDYKGVLNESRGFGLHTLLSMTPGGDQAADYLTDLLNKRVSGEGDVLPPAPPPSPKGFGATKPEIPFMDSAIEVRKLSNEIEFLNSKERDAAKAAKELADMHAGLAKELRDVETAAREAFEEELAESFMTQLGEIRERTRGLRDEFAGLVLSGDKLKTFQIDERATRALAEVDPRVDNADQLRQRIEAQRELEKLMVRKDAEGPSDQLHLDVMIFAEKYAEVIGDLPKTLQSVVPEMAAASGEIRDTLTSDFETVGASAERTFLTIDNRLRSSAELLSAAKLREFDAQENWKRGNPFNIAGRQSESAVLLRDMAAKAARREAFVGFAEGGIVPHWSYFDTGGVPRGTDTVPAMLTPGEGVLSRRGMEAFDRLNRGGSPGGVTVHVDARGAQFRDDRDLDVLADKIQQRIQQLHERVS